MEMDVGSNNRINFRGRRDKEKEKNQKEITGRPISVSFRLELAGDFLLRAYLLAPSTSANASATASPPLASKSTRGSGEFCLE